MLGIIGFAGNVGLIIAVITYVGSEKQRRNAEVLNAWQTLTSAHGQAGSGGRIQALEFLNASPGANWRRKFPWFCAPLPLCTWTPESLAGIDLSVEPADTADIAEAEPADTAEVDKESTSEESGDVAAIGQENPSVAVVFQTNETPGRVYLAGIQLPKADLVLANLQDADLVLANLQDADLTSANLQDAYLESANLKGSIFLATDLRITRNLIQQVLENDNSPLICNSPLPEGIEIEGGKDRDCDKLADVLLSRYPRRFRSLESAEEYVNQQKTITWE